MTMNLVTMLFVYKNLLGEYLGGNKQMQLTSYNEPFYTKSLNKTNEMELL